jgi:hypothetical protein
MGTRQVWIGLGALGLGVAGLGVGGCEVVLGLGDLKDRQADASSPGDANPMIAPDAGAADEPDAGAANTPDDGAANTPADATLDAPIPGADVAADAGDGGSEGAPPCAMNACGGCGTLSATPGAACGTCGKYACTSDKTAVTCNDPGTTNSCPTWCSSQSPPSGVAASDFQCLDFDHGLPSQSVWALTTAKAGIAKISTAAYDSMPNSLQTIANAGSADQGTLTWNGAGATPIKGFTISAAINYTRQNGNYSTDEGEVSLIDIQTGFSEVGLYHTGSGLALAAGSGPTSGGVFTCECPIGVADLTSSIWNTVTITADTTSGNITTTIDGTSSTCACSFKQDTSIQVEIGANGNQDPTTPPTYGWSGYWDNVTVAVQR